MNKIKYPILGYAPGMYMCTCCNCKEEYTGDKYSVLCEPCAINTLNESHSLLLMEYRKLKSVLEKIKDVKKFFDEIEFNIKEDESI